MEVGTSARCVSAGWRSENGTAHGKSTSPSSSRCTNALGQIRADESGIESRSPAPAWAVVHPRSAYSRGALCGGGGGLVLIARPAADTVHARVHRAREEIARRRRIR
jgi:hypothetical protein